jgi:cell division protein FtsA
VHIITGLVTAAKNIYRCIEKAGYEVADIVLEPLASSYSVLHDEEKELGVALIDIGGGTSDVAVFEDATIRHTAVIAVAGNSVTEDIRKGLGIMRDQAEQLKQRFGVAHHGLLEDEEIISIPGIGDRPSKEVSKDVLAQIIQPRLEEILEIAALEIKRSGSARHLAAGVVLTGGGSMIPGTADLAAEILGMDARIGRPMGLSGGLVAEVENPKFATAIGLVLHGLKPQLVGAEPLASGASAARYPVAVEEEEPEETGDTLVDRVTRRMVSWFNEL